MCLGLRPGGSAYRLVCVGVALTAPVVLLSIPADAVALALIPCRLVLRPSRMSQIVLQSLGVAEMVFDPSITPTPMEISTGLSVLLGARFLIPSDGSWNYFAGRSVILALHWLAGSRAGVLTCAALCCTVVEAVVGPWRASTVAESVLATLVCWWVVIACSDWLGLALAAVIIADGIFANMRLDNTPIS